MQTLSNRQREKNGIERILGNSTWREHLNDEQAEKLFSWGADQISRFVAMLDLDSNQVGDGEIETVVDQTIVLMKSMNLLSFQFDNEIRDDTSQPAAEDFLEYVSKINPQSEQAVVLLQTAVNYPTDWSAESAFDFLFSFLEPNLSSGEIE